MARTITIPVESIVTFNSTGNIRVEHTKTVTVEVGESYVLAMLGIKGTSPEKVIQDVMGK